MKIFAGLGSVIGLGLTILPAVLVFSGTLSWQTHANLMTLGMILWFFTAPLWMKKG
jgi:hypothetical protein